MENKAFNIIEIYCSKSIFSIEDSLEKKWLIEKIAKKRSSDSETQSHREMLLWLIQSSLDKG